MTPCGHPDHADAYEDQETGWIITGDEAFLPEEWEVHAEARWFRNQRRAERGRQRKYATKEERYAAWNAKRRERRASAA